MDTTSLQGGDAPVCAADQAALERELVELVAQDLGGEQTIWYRWGGDKDRESGLDCSGYIVVLCRQVGVELPAELGRSTEHFFHGLRRLETGRAGCVALYGRNRPEDRANHVMVVLGLGPDEGGFIVAGMIGGGSWCTSIAAAKARRPQARLRAYQSHLYRPDFLGFFELPLAVGGKAA